MNVLNGLRMAWIKLLDNKNTSNIVYSDDNELIEKKLDEILENIIKNNADDKGILRDALSEIVNRKGSIYPVDKKKSQWSYRLVIDKDNDKGNYLFELSVSDKKVIEAVINTTLKGDVLSFNIKYYTDISNHIDYKSNKGTRVVEIKRLEDGSVEYDDRIYSLDLLNNNYSDEILRDNCVSDLKAPLLVRRH